MSEIKNFEDAFEMMTELGKITGNKNKLYHGEYLFTVDWAHPESNIVDTEHSEIPDQHKCAHILALDNGNFAAQPNNRILWNIPSFTTSSSVPVLALYSSIVIFGIT